ncbi:MAG: SseB family protein [Lachnospiraceae bacterium]|nr:SseB family protein [Lachnospiraceae bacterium]
MGFFTRKNDNDTGSDLPLNEAEILYNMGMDAQDDGDDDSAFNYFRQAAELGSAEAMFSTGLCYENGEGTEMDKGLAAQYYEKAAEAGNIAACFNLGYMYYNGTGVRKDTSKGVELIRKAADEGDEAASEFLEAISGLEEKLANEARINERKPFFIKQLQKMNSIHTIISQRTRRPFLQWNADKNAYEVLLFTSKEDADRKAQELTEAGDLCQVQTINAKPITLWLQSLYIYGTGAICVTDSGDDIHLFLYEAVKRKNYNNIPVQKRPHESPELCLAAMVFMQEARKEEDKRDPDKVRALDHRLQEILVQSRFLVPVRIDNTNGQTRTAFMLIKNEKTGENMIPAFTDSVELETFTQGKKTTAAIMTFEQMNGVLIQGQPVKFVVNINGFSLNMKHDYMQKLIDNAKKRAEAASKGGVILQGPQG